MTIRIKEFPDLFTVETFLNGGIRGGRQVVNASGLLRNLHGKTLIFTAPAAVTVTFDEAAGEAGLYGGLTPAEVAGQITSALAGVEASFRDKVLTLVEAAPASGVSLAAAGTANQHFGFSGATPASGTVYNIPSGAAPKFISVAAKPTGDGYLVIVEPA